MILGGDLGGTKTLLALAEQDAAGGIASSASNASPAPTTRLSS